VVPTRARLKRGLVHKANSGASPTGVLPQPFAGNLSQFRRTFLVDAMRGLDAALGELSDGRRTLALESVLELFFGQIG
jgi:hypothetical protein